MNKDIETTWEGMFPYDLLTPAGITSRSSMNEIQQAMFFFMNQDISQRRKIRPAWDQLRRVERRLFVDFFLSRTDIISKMEVDEHEQQG